MWTRNYGLRVYSRSSLEVSGQEPEDAQEMNRQCILVAELSLDKIVGPVKLRLANILGWNIILCLS